MKTIAITRRQVLRGAGGFSLGLPFLPSIVPVKAYAAEPVAPRRTAFVALAVNNGGVSDANTFPPDSDLTDLQEIAPGHVVRRGKLQRRLEGTDAVLSAVLRAPASELTERLASRLNVLRGLDLTSPMSGHHEAGHLGGPIAIADKVYAPFPTVDQVMAWSPSFYPSLAGVRQRSVAVGNIYYGALAGTPGVGVSYNYTDPAGKTGDIKSVPVLSDPVRLFNNLFLGASAPPAAASRRGIVDRVIADYRRLRDGNRRLSALDRQRLEDHVARLAELQRALAAASSRAGACAEAKAPQQPAKRTTPGYPSHVQTPERYQLQASVLASAFLCGYTRIATIKVMEEDFAPPFMGDWHNDIAHGYARPENQTLLVAARRSIFRNLLLDLARKMDVEESPGATLLDNALIVLSDECCQYTHQQLSMQVVTMGGAGGRVRGGNCCDYRNRTNEALDGPAGYRQYAGLTWRRYLATLLQAMGLPRSEYEREGVPGYWFVPQSGRDQGRPVISQARSPQAGDFLPFLKT